jgi:hypothetical protein
MKKPGIYGFLGLTFAANFGFIARSTKNNIEHPLSHDFPFSTS